MGSKTTMSFHPGQSTLGSFLRSLRASRGLGLAAAAQAAGVHRTTLYRWEQGDALPHLSELEALLSALGADPNQKQQAMWEKLRAELLTQNLTQTHVIPLHQIDCNREVLPMGS